MRYVEGSDLRTLVRAAGPPRPASARRTSSPRSQARSTPRTSAGIVHRDVKPANVLLGASDHAYLTDFGLTKRISSHSGQTRAGGWVGTLGFVAPEQIRGERVDARADVYALGCVLFHTLAGGAAVPARHRRGDALGAPPRGPAVAARERPRRTARAAGGDRPRAGEGARGAVPVGRRPRPRGARRGGPRARRPRRERVVARGAAAPAEAETAASPDQAPTVLAEPAAPRRGGRRPAWVWALAALPVLALGAVAAVALSGGDGAARRRDEQPRRARARPGRPGPTRPSPAASRAP